MTISGSFQGIYVIAANPSKGQIRRVTEHCASQARKGVLPNMMQVMNAITPFMNQPRRSLTPASCASVIFIERDRLGAST